MLEAAGGEGLDLTAELLQHVLPVRASLAGFAGKRGDAVLEPGLLGLSGLQIVGGRARGPMPFGAHHGVTPGKEAIEAAGEGDAALADLLLEPGFIDRG